MRWPDDAARPLTPQGVEESRRAFRGLRTIIGPIGPIASSPFVRACATAEILAGLDRKAPRIARWPELASGEPASPVLRRLDADRRLAAPRVLVSHEPLLSELLGLALTGEAVSLTRLSRAGAASISFARSIEAGAGELDWLLTRRQLMGLGA